MATRHPDEDRDARKQDDKAADPASTTPTPNDTRRDQRRDQRRDEETVDPANDPYRDDPRGEDPNRLPSSALNPQERHDRDIEDLKAAGHDFKGPSLDVPVDDKANPKDPQLRQVTAEDHRTRRDDGLDVPQPPPRSAQDDPKHPLHHLKDA